MILVNRTTPWYPREKGVYSGRSTTEEATSNTPWSKAAQAWGSSLAWVRSSMKGASNAEGRGWNGTRRLWRTGSKGCP